MPFFIPSWAIGAAVIMIAIQVGRAISWKARQLQRGETASDAEVGELREALDAMQRRVAELEERVDFAERLLAKQRDSDRLGGGAG
jgi:uncharacterized protein involved in exopolysaccharide biosynthesis